MNKNEKKVLFHIPNQKSKYKKEAKIRYSKM